MGRLFTLNSARRILPFVRSLIIEAMEAHTEMEQAFGEIREFAARVQMAGGMELRPFVADHWRGEIARCRAKMSYALEMLKAHGVEVKDLTLGLVDFPTVYRGREVRLCWKYDEPDISWWHGAEEGFRGRKPIDAEFELNHGPGMDRED